MQYLVNEYGQYKGTITGSAAEVIAQTPEGHTTTMLPPPRTTDYWSGTDWVAIGTAPSAYHKYSYETKQWVDSRSLEQIKQSKWDQIKYQRNLAEFGGFKYLDMPFDSDQISQVRMIAAAALGQPITWTLADDTAVELTAEEVQGLGEALANHVTTTHARGRLARQLIEQATNADEVEAVVL